MRRQIEYYFSVENLCKDMFLRKKMDDGGWIPTRVIASFNRVRMLTPDLAVIAGGAARLPGRGDVAGPAAAAPARRVAAVGAAAGAARPCARRAAAAAARGRAPAARATGRQAGAARAKP